MSEHVRMMLAQTDRQLIAEVAEVLATPRRDPADSFVLHASLELLARAHLLPLATPDCREASRLRLRMLAQQFEAAGDPVDPPPRVEPDPDTLVTALAAGDLDIVDAQMVGLARVLDAFELRAVLAEPVVRSLAAAAHGSILLHLLTRDGAPTALPLGLARQAVREMARRPAWHLSWFDDDPDEPAISTTLAEILADVPRLGSPVHEGIHPLMHQAESSGLAPALLRGMREDPVTAERTLSRNAAWSMLQEPPDHAPYGWTHCLTMPQATMRLTDVASQAQAVAATYVVGFRAAFGTAPLDPGALPRPESPEAEAWSDHSTDLAGHLAAFAAAHHDAHLAKYTLACLDATRCDPSHCHLYLAAATRLIEWWRAHDHQMRAAMSQ